MGSAARLVRYLRLKMRSLAIFFAVIGVSLASQVNFLEFAKTFKKSYGSTEEYNKRREIFLQNYNDILRHNQLYEQGKVTWWRKITEHSDLTPEEFAAEKNSWGTGFGEQGYIKIKRGTGHCGIGMQHVIQ